jgi:hypothetical protein
VAGGVGERLLDDPEGGGDEHRVVRHAGRHGHPHVEPAAAHSVGERRERGAEVAILVGGGQAGRVEEPEEDRELADGLGACGLHGPQGLTSRGGVALAQRERRSRLKHHGADRVAGDVVQLARQAQALRPDGPLGGRFVLASQPARGGQCRRALAVAPPVGVPGEAGEPEGAEQDALVARRVGSHLEQRDGDQHGERGERPRVGVGPRRPRQDPRGERGGEAVRDRRVERGGQHRRHGGGEARERDVEGHERHGGGECQRERDGPGLGVRVPGGDVYERERHQPGGHPHRRSPGLPPAEQPPARRRCQSGLWRLRVRAEQPEQAPELGDHRAALVLDGEQRLAAELGLGEPRVAAHRLDAVANHLEGVAGQAGALLGDDAGGDRRRVARRQLRGRRRGAVCALRAAPDEAAAGPRGGEDEEHERDVGGGCASRHGQRGGEREERRVAERAAGMAAEHVGHVETGGQRRLVLLGDAREERGERDRRDRQRGRGWMPAGGQHSHAVQRREGEGGAVVGEERGGPRPADDRDAEVGSLRHEPTLASAERVRVHLEGDPGSPPRRTRSVRGGGRGRWRCAGCWSA